MEKKRNITYDYLRGFAMLSIVIGHLYFYSKQYVGSIPFYVCDTIQIPVFMYISGLLAHVSVDRYGFRKLIWTKVVRLLFPLFTFYIIWGLVDFSNFQTFWLKEYKKGYWFLLVLFELMVTLSFIKRTSGILKVKSIYVTTIIYLLATALFVMIPQDGLVNRLFCVKLYWHFFPFFMMGYYSYRLDKFLVLKYAPFYLLAYLIAFYFYIDKDWSIVMKMACHVPSLLFLVTLFSSDFKPLKSVFSTIGTNSLQVYMIHFFLLFPLLKVLPVVENAWLEFFFYLAIASALIFVTIVISKPLMKNSWLAMFLFGIRRKS